MKRCQERPHDRDRAIKFLVNTWWPCRVALAPMLAPGYGDFSMKNGDLKEI
jgi:hypothetical protein